MQSQKQSWDILEPAPEQYFWRLLITTGGSTCTLERGRDYTSSKERQRLEEPAHRPPHQSSKPCRQIAWEAGKSASHQPPGEQQCVISNTNRIQEVPCPEHRICIPGKIEGSDSFLRSFKCIWQRLERGASRKTTEDRCASQDVHVDPALPVCKDCTSEAWWHVQQQQQKSLPSRGRTSERCSVSLNVLGLRQYHHNKEGLKHTTCRRPGKLECIWSPLPHKGPKKPSMVSTSGHWTGALR